MKKISAILFVILFYSCGDNSTGTSVISGYWDEDQNFIDKLSESNGFSEEILLDYIESVTYNWAGNNYYRIKKLYLSNLDLDTLPPSIGDLDSLKILMLNDNNLKYLPISICNVYDLLDSLDIRNNDICTPSVPDCIINTMTVSDFYDNQQCVIIPDEEDQDFILDLIYENWGDTASTELIDELNNLTTWENFIEGTNITARITEIRFNNKGITKIPNSISDLDSLERIEIQDNAIEYIPGYIGSLSRLMYFTIQKNNLTFLPPQIGGLAKLEVLKIYENQLIEVHQNVGQLSNLTILYLSENQLVNLPDSMCNILANPGIDINVDNNQICSDYPECFTELIENSIQDGCP